MPSIIEVRDLVKRYRQAEANAVDGVSFDVAPGAFFALLGPNGAGKTTTISILTTTLAPTAGTVRVAGHDVVSEAPDVRRSVGIIFQNPSLDLNLTAEENIRFHAVLYGLYPFRPAYLMSILSHLSPLRYGVDLTRAVFYSANPAYADDYAPVVLAAPTTNLAIMTAIFAGCLVAGTVRFVRSERNR